MKKRVLASLNARLIGGVFLMSAITASFVGLAIKTEMDTIERASRLEAEHVATTIASVQVADAIGRPKILQAQIDIQHLLYKRDAVIVDTHQVGLADVDPNEVGKTFNHDSGDEVGMTIADGLPRAFIEKNENHPQGAKQVVVALHEIAGDSRSTIVGAVILEYTQIYEELFSAKRDALYVLIGAGFASIVAVSLLGMKLVRRLLSRIEALEVGVTAVAAGNYDARITVSENDEMGRLGTKFNRMAADLHSARAALLEHEVELERRVTQRTLELHASNTLLAQEVRGGELAAEKIEFLAYYDSLTTLPNRSMFGRLLERGLAEAKRYKKQLAVLFIDLDRFKQINDSLGHQAGDELLQEIARRLKSNLRESDAVARLGGDEFVVMLTELNDSKRAGTVAEKLLVAISRPVTLHGQEFNVTGSIGISTYPEDGGDERALMKSADTAMYQAKAEGKNVARFYSSELNNNSLARLSLESSLRHALEHNEFTLHYQPKIDLKVGGVVGVEALLRWQHPELGMIPPLQFISIAEETGLIVPIGKWVLKTACAQSALWHRQGLPTLAMAVNLSPRQFVGETLLKDIQAILEETGMAPHLLELEITESMLMANPTKATETLTALKEIGTRLAIDDFGTGYSSLSNLKLFPIDTIKIDRSFIRNLPEDREDQGITDAIIAMGKALSLTVIAEGVETQEQAEFLRSHDCDEFQGFYFSKAVPANELEALLRKTSTIPQLIDSVA